MAHIYVRSSDGSNSDNGSTWALAKATVAGADAIDAAGDQINIASTHSESTAGTVTLSLAGTAAAPTKLLSVSDAAEPPTALAAGATIGTTGSNIITINGYCYSYGLVIEASSSTSHAYVWFANANAAVVQVHESMKVRLVGSGSAGHILLGRDAAYSGAKVIWQNSTVKFANSSNGFQITSMRFEWRNGINGGANTAIESGGTSPTALFKNIGDLDSSSTGRGSTVIADGLDLSNASSSMHICGRITGGSQLLLRNCRLPSSWSGSLVQTTCEFGAIATMVNCDNGDTNYKFRQQTAGGIVDQETTLIMTGGASDGDTPISHKVVTNTSCGHGAWWQSPEMYVEITSTGAAKTITLELLRDSATNLTDAEVWVEVTGPTNASYPLSTTTTDLVADALTTAADQASSSVTWTTTGMTNPNKQKCSVSVTPQEKGWYTVRLMVAKASTTLYYNPEPVVS